MGVAQKATEVELFKRKMSDDAIQHPSLICRDFTIGKDLSYKRRAAGGKSLIYVLASRFRLFSEDFYTYAYIPHMLGLPLPRFTPSLALGLFFNFLPPFQAVTALWSRPMGSSFLTL